MNKGSQHAVFGAKPRDFNIATEFVHFVLDIAEDLGHFPLPQQVDDCLRNDLARTLSDDVKWNIELSELILLTKNGETWRGGELRFQLSVPVMF